MKTEDTVEYNSLRWVKKELDLILSEAQTALSLYIEEKDESRLGECADHLHMVHGTLQMVELYGAAQLAEEMYKVAAAVLEKSLANEEDAYDVLMRSMLQLPDYLESLQAGSKDVPMVLLPLLNDLRASRNASLLSENVLFFPDIEAAGGQTEKAEVVSGQLQAMAKKLRPHYQIGLLGWFRGQKVRASQKRILAVLNEFEKISSDSSAQRLWSISAALIEGLMLDGLDSNVSVKMLMGQVDRNIHHLIKQGEVEFVKDLPAELLKNQLYYVARIEKDSPRINQIKETYRLKELLPDSSTLEEARSGLGGLNSELLRTVSQGIREDLLEVKDALEIFVHSDDRSTSKLTELPQLLNKIADTLAMLGLGSPREEVLDQRTHIENIIAGSKTGGDDEMMGIAGVLLSVESQLNSFIANRSSDAEGVEHRVGDLADMPSGEYREVLSTVIGEALRDFNAAKQAIIDYLENTENTGLLTTVYDKISVVCGAMFMLPLDRLEPQLKAVLEYVDVVLIKTGLTPDAETQDILADVITSIEYYLEAVLEGRPDIDSSFAAGNVAAQKLMDEAARCLAATDDNETSEDVDEIIELADDEETVDEIDVDDIEILEETASPEDEVVLLETSEPEPDETNDEAEPSATEERFVILGDDADEEILEIFIEEALEELESLNEHLPRWISNTDNEESLTTIRRSFHTLKGSGRLIGAELIGEFAWSLESLLNKVIDNTRPADQEVFDVLQEAVSLLPQLIEQLKGNREPIPSIYSLIDKAGSLAKKRQADEPPVVEVEDSNDIIIEEDELTLDDTALDLPIDDAFSIDISEDELQLAEDNLELIEPEIESEESVELNTASELEISNDLIELDDLGLEDDFNIDLTEDLEELQLAVSSDPQSLEIEDEVEVEELILEEPADEMVASSSEETLEDSASLLVDVSNDETEELQLIDTPEIETEEIINQPLTEEPAEDLLAIYADPVLFQIYKNESETHLAQLREMLFLHHKGEQKLSASPELIRALHTLYGSARTAEVEEIAELSGGLEKYVRAMQSANISEVSDDGVQLIEVIADSIETMLDTLSDPSKRLHSDPSLLLEIKKLISSLTDNDNDTDEDDVGDRGAEESSATDNFAAYGDVDDELVDIFIEEAEELIDGCENSLQRWGNDNNDTESVNDLQRLLHTLKGGARMADLPPIGDLTHALESLIIAVTNNQINFSKEMSNILNDAMDSLSDMIANVKKREGIPSPEKMIRHLNALRNGESIEAEPEVAAAAEIIIDDASDDDALEEDLNDLSVLLDVDEKSADDNEAGLLHSDEPEEEIITLSEPENTAETATKHEAETSSFVLTKEDTVELEVDENKSGIAHEQVRVRSDLLNSLVNNAGEVSVYHARMGQQVSNFAYNLSEMEQTVVRLREQLRQLTIETEAQILSRYEKESDQYDVDFDPLEMDRFSTMQQISRSLSETVNDIDSIKDYLMEEVRDAETLLLQESRVSTELQEGLMRTRMVHFGGLASRLRRIVRQTSRELSKEVSLEILGETTEVDRTVLDRIIAPLEHMLRNAVSHGIELPDVRRSNGKDSSGRISISVDREGSDVVIKVIDDGGGIDVDAIRKQAIKTGMLDEDSGLADHDVLQFIMEPGFSTATEVTQISGRGVGMDVVDSEIKQLGGVLEIDTVIGSGTTFTVRLPLTLAINHALLVNVGEDVYAVPLNSIEGVVRLNGPELQAFYDSEDSAYEFAGTRYELRHLGKMLHGQQANYARSGQLFPVLLARVGEQRVALHVDDLVGRREIVVKPVGPQISTVRGVSGATILGDGRVVLILEMNALVLGESLFHVTGEQHDESELPHEEEERETIVMVVDDSITIRKVTERILLRHNMKVIMAKDGVDAVAQLQDHMPDVMLLDIEMPRMDGYEVATHVRNDERLKNLPIIMITSRTGSKHRDKAMEIGVNKYLGKPYQEDELMQTINELIG